jgi:uncharacterized repeat protein (TIGR01451 family)
MLLSWKRWMSTSSRARVLGFLLAGSLALLAAMSFGAAGASAFTTAATCALPGSEFQGGDGNQNTPSKIEQEFCSTLAVPPSPTTRDWQSDVAAGKVVTSTDPQANDNELTGKENVPNNWKLGAHGGGVTPPKDNIITAWSEVEPQVTDTFLYLAFQREGDVGTTFLTFELNQVKGEWENKAGSRIPCRTTGDVLISYEVSGSSIGEVVVQEWISTATKSVVIEGKPVLCGTEGELKGGAVKVEPAAGVQGAMNEKEITNFLPDPANGKPATIGKNLFGEAALDLVKVLKEAKINPCFDFGQIWMHTRSSLAVNSELHDYIAPVPLLVQSCSISGRKFDDANGNKEHDPNEAYLAGWKFQLLNATTKAVVQEATTDSEGKYTFTKVEPGTYIVEEVPQSGWTCDVPGEGTACRYEVTIDSEHLNVTEREFGNKPTSEVVTTQEPASGSVGSKFGDSATVSGPATGGAPTPTGTVEFRLYSDNHCGTLVEGPISETLSGGSASIEASKKVTLSTAGEYWWVATYGGDSYNASASSGCEAEPITVLAPEIKVEKKADAASVSAGSEIGFTVTVKNTGAGEATGVELKDALPGGNTGHAVTWAIDGSKGNPTAFELSGVAGSQKLLLAGQPVSLASGASLSVHITAPTSSTSCTAYNNTAEVTATNDGSSKASASEEVLCAAIKVTKTADAASVSAGTAIGFNVTIENTGLGEARGVELKDALPGGNVGHEVTWSIDGSKGNSTSFELSGAAGSQQLLLKGQPVSLAAGAKLTVHITAPTSSTSCTKYENTAEATTGNDGSSKASASEEVLCAAIKVTKTADAASVSAGSPIGFTVTVENTGAGEATGVELKDALPGGNTGHAVTWAIDGSKGNPTAFELSGAAGSQQLLLKGQPVSLAAGASLSVHVTAPTSSSSCGQTYNNTAEATTTNDGSSKASASEEVLCAAIKVTKTADAASVSAGSPIGFTVTVENTGAGEATGVELKDALPGGNTGHAVTWAIDGSKGNSTSFELSGAAGSQQLLLKGQPVSLAAGASLSVHVTAGTSSTSCATYNNTAEATTGNDGSSKASASEEVLCAAIKVTKTADAASVSAGSPIGFTVTVKNTGAGEATGVELKDALPGGTAPVTWSIDGSTGNPTAFELSGAAGSQQLLLKGQPVSLAAGASLTVHVTAPTSSLSCGQTYNNTAEATTSNDGSGTASASEAVLCAAIKVTKTADAASVSAGSPIGFTVTIENTGAGEARGVELKDALPGGNASTPVTYSIDGSTGNPTSFEVSGAAGSQQLMIKGGSTSLAAGAKLTVHVTAPTSPTSCTKYENTAEATTANDGSSKASASESVLCSGFTVEKLQKIGGGSFTKNQLTGNIGETVDYEILVTNTGEAPLKLELIVDVNCTNMQGPGKGVLAAGESTTYTCEHKLTEAGTYTNVATVAGNEKAQESNPVSTVVPAPPTPKQVVAAVCSISEGSIKLHGASGSKRGPFTVTISALGIKQITFYLDGHKLKTFTSAQAKNGKFTVRIDPRKLRFGAHSVSIKTVMSDANCAKLARAGVFVHPHPPVVKPKFTG